MTTRSVPNLGEPPRLDQLDIQTHTLPNGLLIACVEQRHIPIVDIELVIRAGAALDGPELAGRAVMVAEMLDEGTRTRDVFQIAEEIDYLGAHLSISAGWDTSVVGLHVLSGRLDAAFDVMADVALEPSFPQAEFDRKTRERLSGLLQDRDDARMLANKALARGVFGANHPYGQPTGGTYESISALKLDQVREFYSRYYHPANAFIVVVGDIAFDDAVRMIQRKFGSWTGTAVHQPVVPEVAALEKTHVLLVDKPRSAQAEVRVGHPGPPRKTPDYFPLVVMNTMLGGSFTSRLNLKLREEMGVTYGASSKLGWRARGGMFWAASAVDSEAAAASVSVMLEEMRRLRDEPIDKSEMERAAQYIAYGMPRAFETMEDVAAHLREQVLHGFPHDYWASYVDRVLAVTPAEVHDVAVRHLQPEQAVAVVVADKNAVEAELRKHSPGIVKHTEVEA